MNSIQSLVLDLFLFFNSFHDCPLIPVNTFLSFSKQSGVAVKTLSSKTERCFIMFRAEVCSSHLYLEVLTSNTSERDFT